MEFAADEEVYSVSIDANLKFIPHRTRLNLREPIISR